MQLNKKELECLIDILEEKIEWMLDDGQVGICYEWKDGSLDELSFGDFIDEIREDAEFWYDGDEYEENEAKNTVNLYQKIYKEYKKVI